MKRKMFAVFAAICLVLVALFAVGCGKDDLRSQVDNLQQQLGQLTEEKDKLAEENEQLADEKGELSGELAQLQEMFSSLEKENAMTLEQLASLQQKFDLLSGVNWLYGVGYSLNTLLIEVKDKYTDHEFTIEDFKPIELSEVKSSLYNKKFYVLTLKNSGSRYLMDAIMKLINFDFIEIIDLNSKTSGAEN